MKRKLNVAESESEPAGWTEGHEKELRVQRKKAKQREEEAAREGHVDWTSELAEAVDKQILRDLKADGDMANKAKRQESATRIMKRTLSWDVLRGRRVWVGPGSEPPVMEALVL